MRTCDTCSWWRKSSDEEGVCVHPKLSDEDNLAIDGLAGHDIEMGVMPPCTGPKFGCIHHQESK